MNILLIRGQFKGDFDEYTAPPLGLAYLASVLEEKGNNVKILDGWVENLDEILEKEIIQFVPDIIGLTGLTVDIDRTFSIARRIRQIFGGLLVFGGPHASMTPVKTLQDVLEIDVVVIGEGERTMLELVDYAKGKKKLSKIKGIYYREKLKNGKWKIKFSGFRELIKNIDEIPFPARHLLKLELYKHSPKEHKRLPGTDILTSRGCPYQCAFCFKQVFGDKYRANSPEYVVKEIKMLVGKYKIKDLFFRDDTFTIDKERVKKICQMIIAEKIDITFTTLARVDKLDYETLSWMKKAGCWKILLGIESGNQKSLNLIRKGITLEQITNAVDNCRKLGIETDGFFILGLPGENKKDALNTINFAKSLKLDFAQFYICTPYPGTYLYEIAKKYGKLNIKEGEWEKFNQYGAADLLFIPKGWTAQELREMQQKAWRSFYLRPGYILKRFGKIRSFSELKGNLIGALKLFNLFKK